MKVKNNANKKRERLEDIKSGIVFKNSYNEDLYMKIEPGKFLSSVRTEGQVEYAVHLLTGSLTFFESNEEITSFPDAVLFTQDEQP